MTNKIIHKFVDTIPDKIEPGIIYISVEYTAVVHKCFCGCGKEVNTPLSPTDWKVTFDGDSISLYPSVGNWNLDCQSHYWIKNSVVYHAEKWSKDEIDFAKSADMISKTNYYLGADIKSPLNIEDNVGAFSKFKNWLFKG